MEDSLNPEGILSEILDVLEKHAIPATAFSLDIAVLSRDFDVLLPEYQKHFKPGGGMFRKSFQIRDTPAVLQIKRRTPYLESARWLEQHVLPFFQKAAAELEREFDGSTRLWVGDPPSPTADHGSYGMSIECRRPGTAEIEGDAILFYVELKQRDAASQPKVHAEVAWLVDEESGGEFGFAPVRRLFPGDDGFEAAPYILEMVEQGVPGLYRELRLALKIDQRE